MFDLICKRIPSRLKIIFYKIRGRRPWSMGYFTYKFEYIKTVLSDLKMLEKFKKSEKLPDGYGYALDERVVEYPWVLSRINNTPPGNLLDAGSALNYKQIIEFSGFNNKKIIIANLNPEAECFWQKEISYYFGDIRMLPFQDECFDYINCLSTLEHIGMDNIIHTKKQKDKEENLFDFEKSILELKRVLKKEAKIFITVPFGKYQNFGWFQQFDYSRIDRILKVFNPSSYQINYYKYGNKGWNISDKELCKNVEYSKNTNGNFLAGAMAVACIELKK